jgi:hypothetical protein
MKKDNNHPKLAREKEKMDDLPGYPGYSEDDDIYYKGKEERDIDPEDIFGKKETTKHGKIFSNDSEDDESGNDLDIPGSELDDDLEVIGSEDEENNYYSLSDENSDDQEDLIE